MRLQILTDGTIFQGYDLEDLARQMKLSQFTPDPTIEQYMQRVKERVGFMYEKIIETDSVEHFIYSLQEAGLIRLLD